MVLGFFFHIIIGHIRPKTFEKLRFIIFFQRGLTKKNAMGKKEGKRKIKCDLE